MFRFNRKIYFDMVRESLFGGDMNQEQVDGQEAIIGTWELHRNDQDHRFLAYELATTAHETAWTLQPIEEYGKGSGHDYGEVDPETGQTYYGRGYVQLTWRDNYAKADREIKTAFGVDPQMEYEAVLALNPKIAAGVLFLGMEQGWFRGDEGGRQTLERYFNFEDDDPVNARDIINGDISKNGSMIAGYHEKFLEALRASWEEAYFPDEEGEEDHEHIPPHEHPAETLVYRLIITGTNITDVSIEEENAP
jgi:hypothetical protein